MKFAPGQPADVPEPAKDVVPLPPRGRPVSAYAAILDGQTLWLAIDPAPGSLALRHTTSGEIVALRSDLAEDNPAYRSIRADLTDITDVGDPSKATYEVVLVPPGGGEPLPVWTHPLPATGPVRIPPARDGVTQYDVRRAEDGTLQIHRSRLPPAAELRAISVEGSTIHISLGSDAPGAALLMLNKANEVLASFPLTGGNGVLRAIIHRDELPTGVGRFARMVVGAAESWVPIRRRHNDLRQANTAVELPQLFADDSDRPRLTFHFNPQAMLTARLLDPDDTLQGEAQDEDKDEARDQAQDQAQDDTDEGDDA